jgi:hypothetical protein
VKTQVSVRIEAPPRVVWTTLADLPGQVRWMVDAEAIRFVSTRRRGVGTTFECDTRLGPFRLVDRMTVTEWRPRRALGVDHTGVVAGTGRFRLRRRRRGRTEVVWEERLRFPWWLGGPVGAFVSRPMLRAVWRRNLANLERLVEAR